MFGEEKLSLHLEGGTAWWNDKKANLGLMRIGFGPHCSDTDDEC